MIDSWALRLAQSIKKANPDETASIEVMKFSLIIILNTLSIIFLSLVIGGITGKFLDTAITLVAFGTLKFFSGGTHLKSSDYCVLWTTAAMVTIPHIPILESWIIWMTGFSLIMMILFAPANMNKKARIPEKFYPVLKVITVLIVSTNFYFHSDILAKAFVLQALFIMPLKRR